MLKKRRFILIVFIVMLGMVLSINFLWDSKDSIREYENQIERRISAVVEEFDEDYINLLMNNRPNQQVSFLSLTIPTKHPFYLFSEQGELLYWSDNEMIPKFDDFQKNRKFQLIVNTKGTYLSHLRKLSRDGQGFWMVQVFSLHDNVEIQNEFLNAGPNPKIFGNDRFVLSSEPKEEYIPINRKNDEYLFSILFRVGYESAGQDSNQTVLVFFFSLLGLVIIIGGDFVFTIWKKGRRVAAIVYSSLILLSIRAIMVFFNFPQSFSDIGLFDPSNYASSLINPSLGDLMLNVMCLMVIFGMMMGLLGSKRFLIAFLQFKNKSNHWIFFIMVYFTSTGLMFLYFFLFSNIVNNSQWNLNILSLPTFDHFKLISLFIIFLAGAGYLLFTIIGLNMILYKNPLKKKYALKVLLIFSFPIAAYLAFLNLIYLIPFLAHFILLTSIITFKLYDNLFKLGLNTFLKVFLILAFLILLIMPPL